MNWLNTVNVKHLFTEKEDHESIQNAMNAIADVLDAEPCFWQFSTKKFRSIPKGDEVFGPVDYANAYLDEMYEYADQRRIWIG